MERIKQKGKLYLLGNDDPAAEVECQITTDIDRRTQLRTWRGTLQILKEYESIRPLTSQDFKLQLEDGRSGKILITHHRIGTWGETISFQGSGPLE